jgi:hypothetical protein
MGLFTTPEQYQQAQRQQVQTQLAREAEMDPYQRVNYLAGMSGYGLGKLAGGVLGTQDPMLQQLSAVNQLAGQFDTGTSQGVAGFANALRERGLYGPAAQLASQVAPLRLKEAEAQAKTMEKLTNEQKNAAAGADSAGLQRGTPEWTAKYNSELARLTAKDVRTTEQKNFEQAVDDGYKGTFNQWLLEQNRAKGISFSPEIKMTNQELDWRKQFLSENKPVIEQAANVQQSLNLLQQSQTSPFADAAFANTVVSAFGGDKQKSRSEIDRLVKAGSLDERVANIVKGFFEGTTSAKTKEDQLKVLTAVDKILEQRYNNSAKAWSTRLTAAKVNPELIVPTYAETVGVGGASKGANLPPEGTRLRNKATGKIEVVRNGKLVPE